MLLASRRSVLPSLSSSKGSARFRLSLALRFSTAGFALLFLSSGCAELSRVKVTELRPGNYCEIEMAVPPNATDDSHHCYMGTVKEITHEEVVLTDVMEETNIDYGGSAHHRESGRQKRDEVRVPLTGVVEIWAERSSKSKTAQATGSGSSPAAKLPSEGAHPVSVPAEGSAHFD
jgi:hypothetical protein